MYRNQFHLNDTEIDLISALVPKRQFLIKNHEIAKVANLEVDAKELLAVHERSLSTTASGPKLSSSTVLKRDLKSWRERGHEGMAQ